MLSKRIKSVAVILIVTTIILFSLTTLAKKEVQENQKDPLEVHKTKLNKETYDVLKLADETEHNFIIAFENESLKKSFEGVEQKKEHKHSIVIKGKSNQVKELLADPEIKYVELDQLVTFSSDTVTWNVQKVKAETAWENVTGEGVKVAILDSGIAPHVDLTIEGGISVISDDYTDVLGHGTQVAGVLSAITNDEGLKGVSHDIELYAVKITDSSSGSLSDAIAGLQWAMDNHMNIVVMSFGFDAYSQIFKEKVKQATAQGMILVGAAGNNGEEKILYPAAYSDVIAVGATDQANERAGFSNYGYPLELVAPGTEINTTTLDEGYAIVSGTSFAVPHVAGVAALIKQLHPELNNTQIRGKLRNDAVDLGTEGRDAQHGFGLVQANLTTTNYTFTDDEENITDVKEDGIFELQSIETGFSDTFTSDGSTTTDGYGWIEAGEGTFYIAPQKVGNENDAYCLDENNDGTWEECVYDDAIDLQDCQDYSQTLSGLGKTLYNVCTGPGPCFRDAGLDNTYLQDSSFTKIQTARVEWYWDCDANPTAKNYGGNTEHFYIFDRRNTSCSSSTQYQVTGRYDNVPPLTWQNYNLLNCPATKECDYTKDGQETASETTEISPCRQKTGETCNITDECIVSLTCTGGTCINETTTDLSIVDVIPIQVIPNVDMVKDKTGYILVIVKNNGPNNTTGLVNVTFDSIRLNITTGQNQSLFIPNGTNATFNFTFKPTNAGSKTLSANVTLLQ